MILIDADELRKQFDEGVWNDAVAEVDSMPTIEAVPVVYAEWLEAEDGDGIVCSRCGEDFCTLVNETDRFKMCHNCGADVRKGGAQ